MRSPSRAARPRSPAPWRTARSWRSGRRTRWTRPTRSRPARRATRPARAPSASPPWPRARAAARRRSPPPSRQPIARAATIARVWGLRRSLPARLARLGALLAVVAAPPAADAQEARAPLDIRVFARVGAPGQPEAIAVARDRTVYVGTNQQERGDSRAPSRIFAYAPNGALLRDYVVAGQE